MLSTSMPFLPRPLCRPLSSAQSSTASRDLYTPPFELIASMTSCGGTPVTRTAYSPRLRLSATVSSELHAHEMNAIGPAYSLPSRYPALLRLNHTDHPVPHDTGAFYDSLETAFHL